MILTKAKMGGRIPTKTSVGVKRMRTLNGTEVSEVSGGVINVPEIGVGIAAFGLGLALTVATGGIGPIAIGIIWGAGTAGEIGVAAAAVGLAAAGGGLAGAGVAN